MNLTAAQWAFELELPPALRHCLLSIANAARRDGWAFIPQDELAATCGVKQRQMRNQLKALEAKGLIRRQQRYANSGKGGRLADAIQVRYPGVDDCGKPQGLPAMDCRQGVGGYRQSVAGKVGGVTGNGLPVPHYSDVMGKKNNGESVSHDRTDVDKRKPPRRSGELERVRIQLSPEDEALLA